MLDSFFLTGPVPQNAMTGTFVPSLVFLSFVIASLGSYVALTFSGGGNNTCPLQQKSHLLLGGALPLGAGIWSMHFIGMLAFKMDMPMTYDIGLTLCSMVTAIVVAYSALWIVNKNSQSLSIPMLLASSLLLGAAISGMHYTGMAAMKMGASIRYIPSIFIISVVVGIVASGAALLIISNLRNYKARFKLFWTILASMIMGIAICGMHYTGMAASVFIPDENHLHVTTLSPYPLALAIAAITMGIFGLFIFRISRRLFFLLCSAAILACPLVVIVYQATMTLRAEIEFSQAEQNGAKFHRDMLDLLQDAQKMRGIVLMVRYGDKNAARQFDAARHDVLQAISSIDKNDEGFEIEFGLVQEWQNIKSSLARLITPQSKMTPLDEFEAYSKVCGSIHDMMDRLADASNLTLDPQQSASYLANAMVDFIPKIIESAGKMRGLTSGLMASGVLPQYATTQQINDLKGLHEFANSEDKDLASSLRRVQEIDILNSKSILFHERSIKPELNKFSRTFENMILQRKTEMTPYGFWQLGVDTTELYDELYDDLTEEFLVQVSHRQTSYVLQERLVLYSSLFAFVGFSILFSFLYFNLKQTEQARQSALKSSEIKSDFLANMSHELRTPLNSIIGLTRMLYEDEKLDAEHRDMIGIAHRSADNLLDIINDILDLSKVESGALVLEKITFSLQEVVNSAMEVMLPLSSAKGLKLSCNVNDKNMPYLLGDPVRLGRVMINLIGNAIKYTEKGSVNVAIECKPVGIDLISLEFRVTDTGIGIPKEKQELIFNKFAQADSSITRKFGGTGLGLHITKLIVEKMDGVIDVESEVGKGSCFRFTVPFKTSETRPIIDKGYVSEQIVRLPASQRTRSADVNILMVEDHLMNQAFLRKLIPNMGLKHFDIADNGYVALETLNNKSYDIVLMDCHMPGISGYEVATEIRNREKATGRHIPIIAMTADAMVGTRERCLKAGMDSYISKPINPDELRNILSRWVTFDDEPEASAADNHDGADTGATVDLSGLKEFIDTEEELTGFIKLFLQESAESLEVLRSNCVDGESPLWAGAAHKLKGGAGMLKSEKLRSLCEKAQSMKTATAADRLRAYKDIEEAYAEVKISLPNIATTGSQNEDIIG